MRIYSNVCERCGGLKTAPFASGIIQHSTIKMCDCPPQPTSKHDGNLSRHSSIEYYALKGRTWVRLCEGGETWVLSPAEALSLLSWLQQEKPTLDRLAKEWTGD